MQPQQGFSVRRKRMRCRFRRTELFLGMLLLALPGYGVFSDVYETATGFWAIPEVTRGAPAVRLLLPEGLAEETLLLMDRQGVRYVSSIVETEEAAYLVFEPLVTGSYRLVYGFERVPGDYLPVTRTEDVTLLEGTREVEFSTHRLMEEVAKLQGMERPLRLLTIYAVFCGFVVIAVCIWYRRALNQ